MIDRSILQQHVKQVIDVVRFLDSSHLSPELQATENGLTHSSNPASVEKHT